MPRMPIPPSLPSILPNSRGGHTWLARQRFSLSALGQKNLQVHIQKQLNSLKLRREEKKAGGDGAIDPTRVFKGIKTSEEAAAEKKEL